MVSHQPPGANKEVEFGPLIRFGIFQGRRGMQNEKEMLRPLIELGVMDILQGVFYLEAMKVEIIREEGGFFRRGGFQIEPEETLVGQGREAGRGSSGSQGLGTDTRIGVARQQRQHDGGWYRPRFPQSL